jgi:hypothetical protein
MRWKGTMIPTRALTKMLREASAEARSVRHRPELARIARERVEHLRRLLRARQIRLVA